MKKFKILMLCLFTFLISGCNQVKDSINGEEFYTIANNYKYTAQDIKSNYDYADSAYLINENKYKILFVEGKRKYDIEGIFIDECKNILNTIGSDEYEQKTDGGDNWTTLTIITEDNYYYVSWIDDTYVYVESPIAKEKEMKKIIDELGY